MEDERIIALYFERREAAIAETEQKYGSYCFTIANGILNSAEDAEECVADTWLRVWQAIPPKRPARLQLFLAKITRNLAFDRWRSLSAEKRGGSSVALILDELSECIADTADVEESVLEKELQQVFHDFLLALPQRERRLFLARYFYAQPVHAIAQEHGMKDNAVSVILSRLRKKLQKHLQKEGYAI